MLCNLFFDNMNSTLELLLIGAFIFAIYWFILRKYNTLGLRLFVLCFLLFVACSVWLYRDEQSLKNTLATGEEHIGTIVSKAIVGKDDNEVQVTFTAKDGTTINAKTNEYVSKPEWESFEKGKPLSVIYVPSNDEVFVQQSIMRFKSEKVILYYFAGFWLLLGTVLLICLRKIRVGVDENTGAEWLYDEDGNVMLDERKSKTALGIKKFNIVSKMVQAFSR